MRVDLGTSESRHVWADLDRLIRTRMLIAASSGGGKSWTIRRLLEQSHGRVQQIVFDYEGEFPSLREKFDYVLVGKGGEIAADVRYAGQLARRLMELNVSAIIDLYELRPDDRKTFVKVFLDSQVNLPKNLWHPCLDVLDEAHVFCPEHGKGESEASEAVIGLTTRGRKRGYCAVLATQDIAKLNKDASGECRNRIIGLAVEDKTRKRAGDELGFTQKQQILSLRTLEAGDFYAFGPAIIPAKEIVRVHIGPVETSHPEVGVKWVPPPPPREKVRAILQKLEDLPKEAAEETNEIVRLRQENMRLQRDLRAKPQVEIPTPVTVEVPILEEPVVRRMESAAAQFREGVEALRAFADVLYAHADETKSAIDRVMGSITQARANGARARRPSPVVRAPERVPVGRRSRVDPPARLSQVEAPSGTIGKGVVRILTAIAQHPEGVSREQLTILTGYKRSSRDTYLQRLRAAQYVEISGDRILVSDRGVDILGSAFQPLPTGDALREHWLTRLPEGERKIFELVIAGYPQAVDREAISEETGYRRSSRDTYLQRLRARRLVTAGSTGVRASDELFDIVSGRR